MNVLLINGSPHAHGCTITALSVAACQSRNPSISQRILSDKNMADKEQIEALYREMYKAMMEKDTATLNRVHVDDFVLTHMTTLSEKTASGCLQQLVLQLTNSSFA